MDIQWNCIVDRPRPVKHMRAYRKDVLFAHVTHEGLRASENRGNKNITLPIYPSERGSVRKWREASFDGVER